MTATRPRAATALLAALAAAIPAAAAAPVAPPTAARFLQLPQGALAYLPAGIPAAGAAPCLWVLLHGAGGQPARMIDRLRATADTRHLALLAPASAGPTWDVMRFADRAGAIGAARPGEPVRYPGSPDGDRVEAAIAALAAQMPVDRTRTILAGFSDGASFALALGTARDHPFAGVVAWSPGVAVVSARPARGRPILITHGRQDRTLPFAFTRGQIVPQVRATIGRVTFEAFEGGHEVREEAVDDAPISRC